MCSITIWPPPRLTRPRLDSPLVTSVPVLVVAVGVVPVFVVSVFVVPVFVVPVFVVPVFVVSDFVVSDWAVSVFEVPVSGTKAAFVDDLSSVSPSAGVDPDAGACEIDSDASDRRAPAAPAGGNGDGGNVTGGAGFTTLPLL